MEITQKEFEMLRDYMHSNYGIDLSKKKELIQSRLSLTLSQRGFTDFGQYIKTLMSDRTGQEASLVVGKLTTNYTYFMREEAHYKYLTDVAFAEFSAASRDRTLRIWSAGCSSGEEPYTIAMVHDSYFSAKPDKLRLSIMASDISDKVLGEAREGKYSADKINGLTDAWKKKYFALLPDERVEVSRQLKSVIEFRKYNLMERSFAFPRKFHVIFCRNVMIYFNTETRRELVKKFYDALEPDGYLFVGMSESIMNLGTGFRYIKPAIYKK